MSIATSFSHTYTLTQPVSNKLSARQPNWVENESAKGNAAFTASSPIPYALFKWEHSPTLVCDCFFCVRSAHCSPVWVCASCAFVNEVGSCESFAPPTQRTPAKWKERENELGVRREAWVLWYKRAKSGGRRKSFAPVCASAQMAENIIKWRG